jgi:hypothetical protein
LLPVWPGVTVIAQPDCCPMLLGADVATSNSSTAPPGMVVVELLVTRSSGLIG